MFLVVLGMLVGVFIKGSEWVAKTRFENVHAELKSLEDLIWRYYDRTGHWPGDCDADGIIGFHPEHTPTPVTALRAGSEAVRNCYSSAEDADAPFSALRLARLTQKSKTSLAGMIGSGGVRIGSADGANLMVIYGIPAWMAQMLDVSIDGREQAAAGRIRRWDVSAAPSSWPAADQSIALAYFFGPKVP